MSKRNDRLASGLEGLDDGAAVSAGMSLEDLARSGYRLPEGDGRLTIKPVSIFDIGPDPKQPRRQIPSGVRAAWNGADMAELFGIWIEMAAAERGTDFERMQAEVQMVLRGEEVHPAEAYQTSPPTPLSASREGEQRRVAEGALLAVVNLAAEIKRDGLINPVTISDPSPALPASREGAGRRLMEGVVRYQIETGERRWLAYHLLYLTFGEEWAKIPAHQVTSGDVWRQASENTARASLNAISMARQLALLLMDLHGTERFEAFYDLVQPGQCDRAFYAQVGDGNQWRIPRGKGEQVCSALGLSHPDMLRKYRHLLTLPDAVWTAADDLNWAEQPLREMMIRAVNPNHLVEMARIEAAKAGYTVTTVTVWDEETLTPQPPLPQGEGEALTPNPLSDLTLNPSPLMERGMETSLNPTPNPSPLAQGGERTEQKGVPVMSDYEINKLLKWAWRWAQGHEGGWFSRQDIALSDEQLFPLWDEGLLEWQQQQKGSRLFMQYRITPAGCKHANVALIDWTGAASQEQVDPPARPQPQRPARPRILITTEERRTFDSVFALDTTVATFNDHERAYTLELIEKCRRALTRIAGLVGK